MTAQEVRDMIARSKQRVAQLQSLGIYDTKKEAYHNGFQDALDIVLKALEQREELLEMTRPKGRS